MKRLFATALASLAVVSSAVFATEIRPGVKTITRVQSQDSFRDIELRAEIWDVETYEAREIVSWNEWECDYEPGETVGNWHSFFNLPKAQKPAALDAAIKGIGQARAEKIVFSNRGYFSSKPRTWNAFKNEMWRIQNDFDDDRSMRGMYQDVIVKFGDDNRRNLGYEYSGGGYGLNTTTPDTNQAMTLAGGDDPWHGYFNVPKAQKPQALANSIRGVGVASAEKIIDAGYFKSKPRTWDAFKDEIKQASNDKSVALPNLYNDVVAKYGSSNKQDLYGNDTGGGNGGGGGYNPPSAPQPPSIPEVHCRLVPRSETIWVTKTRERFIEAMTKRVDVYFENSVLLSGESERIVISWDGRSESAAITTNGAINDYNVSTESRGGVYKLIGKGRIAVRPSTSDFSVTFSNLGGKLTLEIRDHRAEELTRLSSGAYGLNVSFSLVKKGGTCSSDKTIVSKTVPVANGTGSIDLSVLMTEAAKSGDKFQVTGVSIERTGTSYFSGASALGETSVVKY